MTSKKSLFSLKTILLASLVLGGCITTTLPIMRVETAQRIAAPAWMIKRDIPASPYLLRAYERMHERHAAANVYIEGDGSLWTSPKEWDFDPTPKNPVALHLASKDKAENVVYLGRPCQFNDTLLDGKTPCGGDVWGKGRYGKDVIESYNTALNEIARRYDIEGFHLIGYSGGGAVASLLAAERKDVLSLRTVSGVLDHKAQSNLLQSPPLGASLNPVNETATLQDIPQYHFIGGQDLYVPPVVFHSYMQAMPSSHCVNSMLVQEAGHEDGWVNKWPELLELPVTCGKGKMPADFDMDAAPVIEPIPYHEKPEKP